MGVMKRIAELCLYCGETDHNKCKKCKKNLTDLTDYRRRLTDYRRGLDVQLGSDTMPENEVQQ